MYTELPYCVIYILCLLVQDDTPLEYYTAIEYYSTINEYNSTKENYDKMLKEVRSVTHCVTIDTLVTICIGHR